MRVLRKEVALLRQERRKLAVKSLEMKSFMVFSYCLLFCSGAFAATSSGADCIAENEQYIDWIFNNALPKGMAYVGQLMGSNFENILPIANASKWDTYCRELGKIRLCVAASNDSVEDKRGALAIIDKLSPIVCTAEIKAKFPCLLNVSQHPTEQCQPKCQQYKSSLIVAFNESDHTALTTEHLRAACQYVNCRVSCRKDDITVACQPAGLEAAKKLMQAVASLAQTFHQEYTREPGRGAGITYPDQCLPENIIKLT